MITFKQRNSLRENFLSSFYANVIHWQIKLVLILLILVSLIHAILITQTNWSLLTYYYDVSHTLEFLNIFAIDYVYEMATFYLPLILFLVLLLRPFLVYVRYRGKEFEIIFDLEEIGFSVGSYKLTFRKDLINQIYFYPSYIYISLKKNLLAPALLFFPKDDSISNVKEALNETDYKKYIHDLPLSNSKNRKIRLILFIGFAVILAGFTIYRYFLSHFGLVTIYELNNYRTAKNGINLIQIMQLDEGVIERIAQKNYFNKGNYQFTYGGNRISIYTYIDKSRTLSMLAIDDVRYCENEKDKFSEFLDKYGLADFKEYLNSRLITSSEILNANKNGIYLDISCVKNSQYKALPYVNISNDSPSADPD